MDSMRTVGVCGVRWEMVGAFEDTEQEMGVRKYSGKEYLGKQCLRLELLRILWVSVDFLNF